MFLHLSVILFTGRGSASVHAGIPPPPGANTPQSRHLPGPGTLQGANMPLPPDQAPPGTRPPLGSRHPPDHAPPGPGIPPETATVVDGMHPTGMHSYFTLHSFLCFCR